MSFDVRALPVLKFLFLFFFLNSVLFAEDVIVITADRINSTVDKSSNDVRVITKEEIIKSVSHSLPELLSRESDLNITSSGPNGSNTSLFLRGTDSSHTLVVLDGIVLNDPSNPNRQFDIGKLSLNNIERIEILKGSQGLAYGSNAIGGVIVITSKKATSENATGSHYMEFGTFNTVNAGLNFQKKYQFADISFGGDIMNTEGFSAANEKSNPYAEVDGDRRVAFSLLANKNMGHDYLLDLILHYTHNRADLDKGGGAGSDDPNDLQKEEEFSSKIQMTKTWDSGNAETKFSYNRSKHYRKLEINNDIVHPEDGVFISSGVLDEFVAGHTYYISEFLTQNLTLSMASEKDQSDHYNQNLSGFLYHQYEMPSNIFNFGVRLDHNKYFNDHITYKAAAGHKFGSSLLKLSYSTGFRAPSLNQLYDPAYGNKTLNPENSQSVELSLDNEWNEKVKTTTSVFYTHLKNRLSYDPNTFINRNAGQAEITGLEERAAIDWSAIFNQNVSFTLLKTKDLTTGQKLPRRPDLNIKNIFSYIVKSKHFYEYELSYVGKRNDVDNLGNRVQMDSYLVSNLNYRYKLNEQNEFYLKIKNVFNTAFETIYGFGTGGRAFTAGAQYYF